MTHSDGMGFEPPTLRLSVNPLNHQSHISCITTILRLLLYFSTKLAPDVCVIRAKRTVGVKLISSRMEKGIAAEFEGLLLLPL